MSVVRHPPLVSQVSERFRGFIADGTWPVGERIPGELELAAEHGVSRATVREALRGLSLVGLLEPRVGDGTYVRASDEIAGVLARDELSELEHVLDARAGIEATAARLAATRASAAEVEQVRAHLASRHRAHDAGDLAGFMAADGAFHRAIVLASGNPVLVRLHEALGDALQRAIRDTSVVPEDARVTRAHDDLARAIENGDPAAASRVTGDLIEAVKACAPAKD